GWDSYLNASYVDGTCVDNSCERSGVDDRFLATDDSLVFDWTASMPLNDSARVYAKVDNLLDDQNIISRKPDGARPNKPRTIYLGLKLRF
ncbi:MAG: Fe(3+) dicitrate transport protein, partial [Oceanicoccus sp.]